jgi:drug/metabolite transporter (DMT)-like permease
MLYLLLSILSATGIFVIFKIINNKNLSIANIIVVNYLVASLIGQFQQFNNPLQALSKDWLLFAIVIGILFIVFFFLIGLSSKLAGISITTVASKMSVIIPILFSIIYFNEEITNLKLIGILLALLGVLLTVLKKKEKSKNEKIAQILLPLILFIGMGIIDSLLKYTQVRFINHEESAFFSSTLFLIAFLTGLLYTLTSKKLLHEFTNLEIYLYGSLLGVVNFGSIYFLIAALNSNCFDSSIIFGINNVGIVVLSVIFGIFIFKEKISKLNAIGIISSMIAIISLSLA